MPKGAAGVTVDEESFNSADSGASNTIPKQCSLLRKNEVCCIKGRPCKIIEMTTSKTGKHGHAKAHLVGIDIFNGRKYEDICPSTHNMSVPVVKTTNYVLIDIVEEFAHLMDDKTAGTKEDLRLPDPPMGTEIRNLFESGAEIMVNVTMAMDEEKITSFKTVSTN